MRQIVKVEKKNSLATPELQKLQELTRSPTVIGVLEFLTGLGTTVIDKPANLIGSGGRLTQALFKGSLYQQLYLEVQKYREEGKIPEEKLNSNHGRTIFIELMRTIDEESLDKDKFEALKNIFFKSVNKDTDEHDQMLAYQYFLVCKKLSSLDIFILKTAFEVYGMAGSEYSAGGVKGGVKGWEADMAGRLGVPEELVSQSRISNSGVSQNPNTMVFDSEAGQHSKHGLTKLGIAICEFMKEQK